MKATFTINKRPVYVNLSKPMDISIPVRSGEENPLAWYIDPPKITPVVEGKWVAKVSEGAVVNFNNIYYNPHAHGTHTECVGHITEGFHSVNDCLKTFFFYGSSDHDRTHFKRRRLHHYQKSGGKSAQW